MKKPLILSLASAGLALTMTTVASPAFAQPVAPAAARAAVAPLATTPPIGVPSAAASAAPVTGSPKPLVEQPGTSASGKPGALINPYTGKPLSAEQLQRELELSRFRTQMLEEEIKQTNAIEEIKNIPSRKAVEVAQAKTAVKKEEAAVREIEQSMKPSKPPADETPKPVKKSAKALAKEKAQQAAAEKRAAEAAAAQAALAPPATLLSVLTVGGSRSVVLDIGGGVATIADGEMSPAGPVRILDNRSATVGGRTLKVHDQTVGRFVVSDPKPVTPGTGASFGVQASNGSNVTALPPAIPNNNANLPPPPVPGGFVSPTSGPGLAVAGAKTQLPVGMATGMR